MRTALLLLITLLVSPAFASDSDPATWARDDKNLSSLLDLYRDIHSHPEISFQEERTAARLAKEWADAGYDVTTGVGGHGVVAILKNGPGPMLMIRCDMDALPVEETTALPYASTARTTDDAGNDVPVMHACGHDMHMASITGAAQFLATHRDRWSGTLMVIGQPAEERVSGAKAMLEDGLFERFGGKPDFAVGLHVMFDLETGRVGTRSGYSMANSDAVDITVRGRGGHGSAPHLTSDPIAQAAHLVVALQTIVSREVKPIEPAVVTVGSIHGGTKHNIIGDDCKLQITVRSYSPEVRTQLLKAIEQKAKAVAVLFNAPEPTVEIKEGVASLYNDPELNERATALFRRVLGESNVRDEEPVMGAEDFALYGEAGVPIFFYRLGSIAPERLAGYEKKGVEPPSAHSSLYYPDPQETLVTGVTSMSHLAMELLKKKP